MKKILIIVLTLFTITGCSKAYSIKPINTTSDIVNLLLSDVNINESGLDGVSYEFNKMIDNVVVNVEIFNHENEEIANFDVLKFENTANKKFVFTTGFSDEKGYGAIIQKDKVALSEGFYLAELIDDVDMFYLKESGYLASETTNSKSGIYDNDLINLSKNQKFTMAYAVYSNTENSEYLKTYYHNYQDYELVNNDYLVKINLIYS